MHITNNIQGINRNLKSFQKNYKNLNFKSNSYNSKPQDKKEEKEVILDSYFWVDYKGWDTVLPYLLNNGLYTTNFEALKTSSKCTSKLDEEIFYYVVNELLKEAQYSELEIDLFKKIADKLAKEEITAEYAQSAIDFINSLRGKKYGIYGPIKINQNNNYEYKAIKSMEDSRAFHTITLDSKGKIKKETEQAYLDNSNTDIIYKSYVANNNKILITQKDGTYIKSQIEIIEDENGSLSKAIHLKPSDKLQGAFEITEYNLKDYPEDMDIIKAIQEGTIKGGKKLSTVEINPDGSITSYENYSYNNTNTKRTYTQKTDDDGNIIYSKYQYTITDENNNKLLDLNRSFKMNPDNSATTEINGQKYTLTFDDDNYKITIKDDENNEYVINIGRIKTDKDRLVKFYNKCKSLPVQILKLCTTLSINLIDDDNRSSAYSGFKINAFDANSTFLHEAGHIIKNRYNHSPKYKQWETEFKKIFSKEIEDFKTQYPEMAERIVEYFIRDSYQSNADYIVEGIDEFFAETNMLLYSRPIDNKKIQTRAQYLVRYFPKSIAKVSEVILNYKPPYLEDC